MGREVPGTRKNRETREVRVADAEEAPPPRPEQSGHRTPTGAGV
jgi:hypothetical protein